MTGARPFSLEPQVRLSDVPVTGSASWESIDAVASQWLGQPCLVLPSVRIGMGWALEARGFRRHRDHVLVPRFVGRCILNSVGRHALPVEEPTAKTRLAVVVDQYGLRQDLKSLVPEFTRRSWVFLEDSPYGVGDDEPAAEGSLGRFIGLGKVLPVVQGGLLVSRDPQLLEHVRHRRQQTPWPWATGVWMTMLAFRIRARAASYSPLADAAYELYDAIGGGSRLIRRNIRRVFREIDHHVAEYASRFSAVTAALGGAVALPDLRRLAYVVPYLAGDRLDRASAVFWKHGFDAGVFHVDVARNMLAPRYEKSLLLPLNPRIARHHFDALLAGLHELGTARAPAPFGNDIHQ